MEELLSNYSLSDIFIFGFFIGMVFNIIQDIIMSLIDYLSEKAWRVIDYEEIFYKIDQVYMNYDAKNDLTENLSKEEILLVNEGINNYKKRLQKRKNLDRFLNKFRRRK